MGRYDMIQDVIDNEGVTDPVIMDAMRVCYFRGLSHCSDRTEILNRELDKIETAFRVPEVMLGRPEPEPVPWVNDWAKYRAQNFAGSLYEFEAKPRYSRLFKSWFTKVGTMSADVARSTPPINPSKTLEERS